MARRRKKPFVVIPGYAAATAGLLMAGAPGPLSFLIFAGIISVCDFAMRPAIPSIVRSVYPDRCRSQAAGTMRQYASIVFLGATLGSAAVLSAVSEEHVRLAIGLEIAVSSVACAAAFLSFQQLPNHGDGNLAEAEPDEPPGGRGEVFKPLFDPRFRRYLAAFLLFALSNLFMQGVVPAYFARDLGLGYVPLTMLLYVVPSITAFLSGGWLTYWFERTSVWKSYSVVTLLWGLDPFVLVAVPLGWPALVAARAMRGPATLGSMVIAFFTGVHSFARPGAETSRYMAAQFLITGFARLLAPAAAAVALGYMSRKGIIFWGSIGILGSSVLFWWNGRNER
jgi:hypothetical protein